MFVKVLDAELYREEVQLGVFKPKYEGDAGVDVRSTVDITVHAGETVKVPLGIAVDIPTGYVGWLTGRSSTAVEHGLLSHEGKIDSGYRGEIHAVLTAVGSPVQIERGQRIGQLVVLAIMSPTFAPEAGWPIMGQLGETERGERGFGSSGSK